MISTTWGYILSMNSYIIQTNYICLMAYHGVCLIHIYAETFKPFAQKRIKTKLLKILDFS